MLFESLATVVRLMLTMSTQTGLSVTVRILIKLQETGLNAIATFNANMLVEFVDLLPRYNYRFLSQLHDYLLVGTLVSDCAVDS